MSNMVPATSMLSAGCKYLEQSQLIELSDKGRAIE